MSILENEVNLNTVNTEANLMKLHRKIKHNDKVCRVQELGS